MLRFTVAAVAVTLVASFALVASPIAAASSAAPVMQAKGHPVHPTHVQAPKPVKPPKPTTHGNPTKVKGPKGDTTATKGPKGDMTAAQHLQKSPQLAQKLAGMLPAGTNLETAAAGFKNFGQFVAAVHVSNNLAIPFDQLKTLMTGEQHKSLGQAVKTLKPDASDDGVKKAEAQAKKDVGGE